MNNQRSDYNGALISELGVKRYLNGVKSQEFSNINFFPSGRLRKQDAELKERIEDHISALSEVTSLPQEEIERIALEICLEHQKGPCDFSVLLRLPKSVYISLAAILFVGAVSVGILHYYYHQCLCKLITSSRVAH